MKSPSVAVNDRTLLSSLHQLSHLFVADRAAFRAGNGTDPAMLTCVRKSATQNTTAVNLTEQPPLQQVRPVLLSSKRLKPVSQATSFAPLNAKMTQQKPVRVSIGTLTHLTASC